MASATALGFGLVKIEDSPEPEVLITAVEPCPTSNTPPAPVDPKDPEGFLKRCSGYNKKTKIRCSAVIGKKSQQNTHPTFLPTCSAHRDQQSFAGWCQFRYPDGERCGKLFRWTPPYFELCIDHQGHADTPCYFLKLPLELRHEVFRYLLPTKPIGSSTAALHDGQGDEYDAPHATRWPVTAATRGRVHGTHGVMGPHVMWACGAPSPSRPVASESVFPMPLLDLFLVNHQIYQEAKDLLYSIATFTIDIRKDGTFMCGRRLLEPRRADGTSHFLADEADEAKERFLRAFDWAAVKNYSVDVLLENWSSPHPHMPTNPAWDEEVEIYDIRDYVSVVVSGVLAKSKNLCKLQVRLCLADFQWSEDQILANTKLIVSPFERLRNVRQPQLTGVFVGRPYHNTMLSVQRPQRQFMKVPLTHPPICSVPTLPTHSPVLIPGMPVFDKYTADWGRWLSSSNLGPVTMKPPIRAMFTEFKDFYSKLSSIVPDITYRNGRHAFLHRARVAREQEDVESFRHLRNELIQYWYAYLDQEERKKTEMNARLSRMLDTDIYPCHEWEPDSPARRNSIFTQGSAQSPVLLNVDTMAKEGIPMTGNPRHVSMHPAINSHMHIPQQAHGIVHAQVRAQQQAQVRQQLQMQHIQGQQQVQQARRMQLLQQQQQNALQNRARSLNIDPTLPAMNASEEDTSENWDLYAKPDGLTFAGVNTPPQSFSTVMMQMHQFQMSGEPGPSTKRRRVDSGFEDCVEVDMTDTDTRFENGNGGVAEEAEESYVGKGKGKMGVEVISVDRFSRG